MNQDIIEIREAIAAGERALNSLYAAQSKLKSARGWGIFDMLGGGLLSDLMKHSRMNDASSYMEASRRDLEKFKRELADVSTSYNLRMDVDGFLTFADFFFDGLIADYLVQTKISQAREQVDEAIAKVSQILTELKRELM